MAVASSSLPPLPCFSFFFLSPKYSNSSSSSSLFSPNSNSAIQTYPNHTPPYIFSQYCLEPISLFRLSRALFSLQSLRLSHNTGILLLAQFHKGYSALLK